MEAIKATFAKCKQQKRSALVTYVTAGYPTVEETVDILLGLENGGAGEFATAVRKERTLADAFSR
jgi:tryptophan synthase